jgi:type IV pilus assembly protein PilA
MLSINKSQGFTLVELMVVVSIVGLLSSVAVPNFRKYQAKSKMSEAKLHLATAYTAEASFYADFNIYATCLAYMGYDLSGFTSQRFYAVGFSSAQTIETVTWDRAVSDGLKASASPAKDTCYNGLGSEGDSWYGAGKGVGNTVATTIDYLDETTLGTQELPDPDITNSRGSNFRISAGGVIQGDFSGHDIASLLTIDNTKKLIVRRNGY